MGLGMKISVLVLLCLAFSGEINARKSLKTCNFPALFNFGDSNSDTGGAYSLFHSFGLPNGKTTGKFDKRISDGRLIIDFLAEHLGFPHLSEDVDKEANNFRHGVNFAVGSQRINPARSLNPINPTELDYSLDNQVSRFLAFKSLAIANKGKKSAILYPEPEEFSEALYTIDIGQNDVGVNFGGTGNASYVGDFFTQSVQRLLNNGARYLWIHNTCPNGCLPRAAESPCASLETCTFDKYGCRVENNEKAQQLNVEFQRRVIQLRKQYPEAVITLVDMYSAKLQLRAKPNGFVENLKMKYCCGTSEAWCGFFGQNKKNETIYGEACANPSQYLSWDGVHYTEAANNIIAKLILEGSFSDSRVPITQACNKY